MALKIQKFFQGGIPVGKEMLADIIIPIQKGVEVLAGAERRIPVNCPTCGLHIDEHPANRCLDAWVAEAVLGCAVDWLALPPNDFASPFCTCEEQAHEQRCSTFPGLLARYSKDILAAWGIVETFRCGWRGHAAACIDIKISDWVNLPDCQVTIFAPDIVDVEAEAYSPCLAICRAALKVANDE